MDIISGESGDATIAWYENTMDPVTAGGCDSDDNNPNVCSDTDGDTCDDCSNGSYNVANDGVDNDGDGICNSGDIEPDCATNDTDECGVCGADASNDCVQDCADVWGGISVIDDCGTCDDDTLNDCLDVVIDLSHAANLISFYALPENLSVGSIFENMNGALTQGAAAVNIEGIGWIGSLESVSQDDGYWVFTEPEGGTIELSDADPINYDSDGVVVYSNQYGPNLISYSFQTGQTIEDALGDAASNVHALIGQGIAALNMDNEWVGNLVAFEAGSGYWLFATEDFDFSFNGSEAGLARKAVQPKVRAVPELYSFNQSSKQAFYFIESASIMGQPLDSEDIIIAYNGDVVVGSRYWNGEYTDLPAIGYDEYIENEGYCKSGDKLQFKVWDASSNELISVQSENEIVWQDLGVTVVNLTSLMPKTISLENAYPNPFNPVTTLNFSLPESQDVMIQIYNLQGRVVETLIDGAVEAGYHTAKWNADYHASGVYFVKMVSGDFISSQKLILLK
jgi:hypothetical protein